MGSSHTKKSDRSNTRAPSLSENHRKVKQNLDNEEMGGIGKLGADLPFMWNIAIRSKAHTRTLWTTSGFDSFGAASGFLNGYAPSETKV